MPPQSRSVPAPAKRIERNPGSREQFTKSSMPPVAGASRAPVRRCKHTTVESDVLVVELEAEVRNQKAQTFVVQCSHAALATVVDLFGIGVNSDLIGSVCEELRTFRKDVSSLLKVLCGFPALLDDVDSRCNRVIPHLAKLIGIILNVYVILEKPASVSKRASRPSGTKKHPTKRDNYDYDSTSSCSSAFSGVS